jgi:hypothetical protein
MDVGAHDLAGVEDVGPFPVGAAVNDDIDGNQLREEVLDRCRTRRDIPRGIDVAGTVVSDPDQMRNPVLARGIPERYVRTRWSDRMEVLDFIDDRDVSPQNVIVCKKP